MEKCVKCVEWGREKKGAERSFQEAFQQQAVAARASDALLT